jgi:hypothetical protein
LEVVEGREAVPAGDVCKDDDGDGEWVRNMHKENLGADVYVWCVLTSNVSISHIKMVD